MEKKSLYFSPLLFFYSLFFFTNYGNNREEQNPLPIAKICQLTALTAYGSSGTVARTNGRIAKIDLGVGNSYYTFEYNSEGKLSKYNIHNAAGTITSYRSYVHVNANLINFKLANRLSNGTYNEYITDGRIEFDANGNVTKFRYYPTEYWRNEFDAKGNPTKAYYKFSTNPEYLRIEFTGFDDKKNFYIEDLALRLSEMDNNQPESISKNNLLQRKYYNANGTLELTENRIYEYNEHGYVTKKTVGTDVFTYQLNCQ